MSSFKRLMGVILLCEEISVMAPMENVMIVSRIIYEEFSDFYQV